MHFDKYTILPLLSVTGVARDNLVALGIHKLIHSDSVALFLRRRFWCFRRTLTVFYDWPRATSERNLWWRSRSQIKFQCVPIYYKMVFDVIHNASAVPVSCRKLTRGWQHRTVVIAKPHHVVVSVRLRPLTLLQYRAPAFWHATTFSLDADQFSARHTVTNEHDGRK